MILDPKFEQLVSRNFLRSSREYDLAKYFWANSERAMQGKPTQQPTLTTKNLTEPERTYVTDELAKYFAGFSWTVPQWVKDRESDQCDYAEYTKQHNFSRGELQSMQANNRKLIQVIQEDIDWCYYQLEQYNKWLNNIRKTGNTTDLENFQNDNLGLVNSARNRISSSKLKLKKLVALQTKVKRLLAANLFDSKVTNLKF